MVKKAAFSFLSSCSIRDIFSMSVLSMELTSLKTSSALKSSAMEMPRALAILTREERAGSVLLFSIREYWAGSILQERATSLLERPLASLILRILVPRFMILMYVATNLSIGSV